MRKYIYMLAGLLAGIVTGGGLALAGTPQGAAPQTVDLNVPCQKVNQLNCAWYGDFYPAGSSDSPPPYTSMQYYSWAKDDGQTFCRYYIVPFRGLVCATHWPLTDYDLTTVSAKKHHHHHH